MTERPKLAGHVRIADRELLVDGEHFPWYVAPDVTATETGHPSVPWLVHVEIIPMRDDDITCHADWSSPVIGDRPFPWYISEDGYQVVVSRKSCPVLKLAFPAEHVEDVRTPQSAECEAISMHIEVEDAANRLGVDPHLLLGLAQHGQVPFVKAEADQRILFESQVIDQLARQIGLATERESDR